MKRNRNKSDIRCALMNILMVSDVYFPRVNGVSSSIRTFARELKRLGHNVTIVAPDYGDNGDDKAEFDMVRLPSRVIFFDPEDRLIRGSAIAPAIERLAQRLWDVVHIHTPFRAHQLGVRLAKRLKRPTVESYHTFFEEYVGVYLPWLPKAMSRFAARYFSRSLCHGVDHLIVPSDEMTQVLRRYGIVTPSSVIPTGIHLEEFRGGDGARFRHAHGIADDQPTLVTVSRLSAEKNIAFLLDVARALVDEFPRLVFILAGEGPDAERLKRHAASIGLRDHVVFVGNLDRRTTLLDCYKAGDVFVFASPTETQGLVLLEAMSLGVPIVSTAVMGTATVLRHAKSARISGEDVREFAENVAVLLRSAQERDVLADAGPQDAAAWSAPVLMERVVKLYRDLSAYAAVG
jgi:glycosyltransferase involved in cell wall biosynthesis